ncbi:MAG: Fe-S cluster assembly protein SufD [Cyanobacteria bacterium P01_H01_bin.121]
MQMTSAVPNSDATPTHSNAERRSQFLQDLLKLGQTAVTQVPESLQTLQNQAAARIPELAIPSTRQEDWRFTDLAPLLNLELAAPSLDAAVTLADLKPLLLPDTCGRLVFVDGYFRAELSSLEQLPPGLSVGNGSTIDQDYVTYLGKQGGSGDIFATLNTASFRDNAVIWVAANAVIEQPLHVFFVTTNQAQPQFVQPRCLVVAGTNSQLALIEEYATTGAGCQDGLANGCYVLNAVTEICLEPGARLHHSRLQRDAKAAIHIGKTAVTQAKDSSYTNVAIHVGSHLSRHNLVAHHRGEQVETNLQGLAVVIERQLIDTHSAILYTQPNCCSDQLYKAIVTDRGRSVFNGQVDVPQAAQLTNAAQLNRNLLLSPQARVDTKPELTIVADNVKCTHGATISQLEDEEIFYLQSRGIDRDASQTLLLDAFAAEIIQQIPNQTLQAVLIDCVSHQTQQHIQ